MLSQKIEFHKQRDFGNKLNATIEFIKRNFKPLFKSILFIAGPFLILGSLLMTSIFNFLFKNMGTPNIQPDNDMLFNIGASGIGAGIFLLLASIAIISVVYEFMILYEKKEDGKVEVEEVFQNVKSSFWNVFGTVFLFTILLVGIYLVLLIPTVAFGMLGGAVTFLMVMLVIIALLYFMIGSSLVFIIRAYENVGFIAALNRSLKLIKGKWWSTFGLLFVISLIQSVVSSIFFIPWYANMIISMMHTMETGMVEDPSLISQIISQASLFLYLILSYMMYALPLIGLAFQYFNLREMKEASGLINKIDSFGELSGDSKDEEHY